MTEHNTNTQRLLDASPFAYRVLVGAYRHIERSPYQCLGGEEAMTTLYNASNDAMTILYDAMAEIWDSAAMQDVYEDITAA